MSRPTREQVAAALACAEDPIDLPGVTAEQLHRTVHLACRVLAAEVRALRAAEVERLRQHREPCDCGHARREHVGHEDGDGECETEGCECGVYEARGWE